ncbi:MAG: hypothetical protein Q9208_007181 [Pyrenodesmia sp. 3 TL-2023]
MLSELGQGWDTFSQTFCVEKDNINHAFRTLVETYGIILSSTLDYADLTFTSVVVFPTIHMVRFVNNHFLVDWLPQPRFYNIQVKAELRFRMERFIDQTVAALERIDSASLATRRSRSSSSPAQVLEAASAMTAIFQQDLEERMAEFPLWRQWIQPPKDIVALKASLAVAKRVQHLLVTLKEITATDQAHSTRLRSQLVNFRQSLGYSRSFQTSSTSLAATLRSSPDLVDSINGTKISAFKSEIGRLCKERNVVKIVPRELDPVCFIDALRVTLAEIDDDTYDNFQRSWLLERNKAIHRYEVRTQTDRDSHIDVALKLFQRIEEDGSMPAHF